MRRVPLFVLPLVTGLSLAPAPASAQGGTTPPDGITRTEADLGTWDAVLVGHSQFGTFKERGVEINTRGCNGTCIVTKLKGALAPRNGGSRPWWAASDARVIDPRTGLHDMGPSNTEVAPGEATSIAPRTAPPLPARTTPPTFRTSVEYPSDGHRLVTVYRQQPDGTEMVLQRITYTRRK